MRFLFCFLFLSIFFIFKDNILSWIFKKAYNLKLKNSSPFFLVNFFFSAPLASFETWDIRFHWLDLEVLSRDVNVSDHDFGLFNSDIYHECHSIVPYTSSDAELMRSWLIYSDSVFVSFYSNFFKQNLIDSLETLNEADFIYWSNYFELFNGGVPSSSFVSFFDLSVSEIFYIFFTISALLSTLFLFMTHNPVNSILHLVLVFLNVAFLILLLEVEYIALTFMIVYIGAISMLFVFVIMMLDIRKESLIFFDSKLRSWYKLFGFFLFLFILFEFYLLLFDSFNIIGGDKDLLLFSSDSNYEVNNNFMFDAAGNVSENWTANNPGKKQLFFRLGLDNVGHFLYTYYFVYLYIVGFILLVPMLGAIVLTNRSKIVCFFGVSRLLNIVHNFSFFFIYFYFCYNKIILVFSILFNYIKRNMFTFYFTLAPILHFTFNDFFDFYNGDVLFGDDFCSFFLK